MRRVTTPLFALLVGLLATPAQAGVLRVPEDAADIQTAVATASAGDTIMVGAGRWCGALIANKSDLTLVGRGKAVIAANPTPDTTCGPTVDGHRVGFLMVDGASRITIRHFTFDGSRLDDPGSLGVGVFGDSGPSGKVSDVTVEHNTFLGTFWAVNNQGGDRWTVRHNKVKGLGTRNGVGGAAFVVSQHRQNRIRPAGNVVEHNKVRADVPAMLSDGRRWFAAVSVGGALDTTVEHNEAKLDPSGDPVKGVGVLVTDGPTTVSKGPGGPGPKGMPGKPTPGGPVMTPGDPAERTAVRHNDAKRDTDYVVVVDLMRGAQPNDPRLQHNRGRHRVGTEEYDDPDSKGWKAARHRGGDDDDDGDD